MRLKFKKQQFQENAVNSVCNVFQGQSKDTHQYLFGRKKGGLVDFGADSNIYVCKNAPVQISQEQLLKNIQKIQKNNDIHKSQNSY